MTGIIVTEFGGGPRARRAAMWRWRRARDRDARCPRDGIARCRGAARLPTPPRCRSAPRRQAPSPAPAPRAFRRACCHRRRRCRSPQPEPREKFGRRPGCEQRAVGSERNDEHLAPPLDNNGARRFFQRRVPGYRRTAQLAQLAQAGLNQKDACSGAGQCQARAIEREARRRDPAQCRPRGDRSPRHTGR